MDVQKMLKRKNRLLHLIKKELQGELWQLELDHINTMELQQYLERGL